MLEAGFGQNRWPTLWGSTYGITQLWRELSQG